MDAPFRRQHLRPTGEIAADDTSSIAARLYRLGFPNYRSYLASGHWRALRAAYRSRFGDRCQECGLQPVELHHRTYKRLGKEPLSDLIALCDGCHEAAHFLANADRTRDRQRTYHP